MVEAALAHTIKDKAEAAYARSDLLEKRRPLMEAWAEHCRRCPAEVLPLEGGRRAGRGRLTTEFRQERRVPRLP